MPLPPSSIKYAILGFAQEMLSDLFLLNQSLT